ncbi:hypothetical protein BIW11_03840, partial [Tropilaelaps mercedesae]
MPISAAELGKMFLTRRSLASFNDVKFVVVDKDQFRIGRSTFYSNTGNGNTERKKPNKGQIAKAVSECKTRAENAKQLVGDLKTKRLSVGHDVR